MTGVRIVRAAIFLVHAGAALACGAAAYAERADDDLWWTSAFVLGSVYFIFAGLFSGLFSGEREADAERWDD